MCVEREREVEIAYVQNARYVFMNRVRERV